MAETAERAAPIEETAGVSGSIGSGPGGRFDITALPEEEAFWYTRPLTHAAVAFDEVRNVFRPGEDLGVLDAYCVARRDVNAVASSIRDQHRIAVHVGLPCMTRVLFNHLLRVADPYPAGRGWGRETVLQFPKANPLELAGDHLADALVRVPAISRPKDEARAKAADALAELATHFTVLHEVGHIVGGHTAFSERNLRGRSISEFRMSGRLRFPDLLEFFRRERRLRQNFEFEADLIAVMLLIPYIGHETPDMLVRVAEPLGVPSGPDYAIGMVDAAVTALYWLFLYMSQLADGQGADDHAHPLVRVTYVHNQLRIGLPEVVWGDDHDRRLYPRIQELAATAQQLGIWVGTPAGLPADGVVNECNRLFVQHGELLPRYAAYSAFPADMWQMEEGSVFSGFDRPN